MSELPVKPMWLSRSFWAGVLTVAVGLLQAAGAPPELTGWVGVHMEALIGLLLAVIGSWGVWGTVTRSTRLSAKIKDKQNENGV
jgi:hypothetical protein